MITVKVAKNRTTVKVGENTAAAAWQNRQAQLAARRAAQSENFAEAYAGPVFATVADGEDGTPEGKVFRVDNGDGTLTPYLRTASGSDELDPLATTAALATNGAEMIGHDPGFTGAATQTVGKKLESFSINTGATGRIAASESAGDNSARVQAMLNEAARVTREGAREVVLNIDGFPQLASPLSIPDKVRLIMTGGGVFVPATTNLAGIQTTGAGATSFTNLAADALQYRSSVTLASTAAFAVGDMVELRSEADLPGTGAAGSGLYNSGDGNNSGSGPVPVKRGQIFRVLGKTSTVLHLDGALEYDYLVADTAQIGVVPGAVDGLLIEGFKYGSPEDYDARGVLPGNGIVVNYSTNLRIIGLDYWGRPSGSGDNSGSNGVALNFATGAHIECGRVVSGYYGVSLNRACRSTLVRGGRFHRARHAFSHNWVGAYGEPLDTLVEGVEATNSTLAAFDTHDIGKRITFRNCIAKGSDLGSGFQIRAPQARIVDCEARGCALDGALLTKAATDSTITNFVARDCLRSAVASNNMSWSLNGLKSHRCGGGGTAAGGSTIAGGGVVMASGGVVRGVRVEAAATPPSPVFRADALPLGHYQITDVHASYEGVQLFLNFPSLTGMDLKDFYLPGWGESSANLGLLVGASSSVTFDAAPFRGLRLDDASPMQGVVALVAGVATVSTKNVLNFAGATGGGYSWAPLRSNISVNRVLTGGTPGVRYEVTAIANRSSFTITAYNAAGAVATADTSTISWAII